MFKKNFKVEEEHPRNNPKFLIFISLSIWRRSISALLLLLKLFNIFFLSDSFSHYLTSFIPSKLFLPLEKSIFTKAFFLAPSIPIVCSSWRLLDLPIFPWHKVLFTSSHPEIDIYSMSTMSSFSCVQLFLYCRKGPLWQMKFGNGFFLYEKPFSYFL